MGSSPTPGTRDTIHSMKWGLRYSAFAGIVAFLVNVILQYSIPDPARMTGQSLSIFFGIFLTYIVFYVAYMYGFAVLGKKFHNSLITYAAYMLIGVNLVLFAQTFLFGNMSTILSGIVLIVALSAAVATVVLGWQILNLKKQLGPAAVWYGSLMLLGITGVIGWIYAPADMIIDDSLFLIGSYLLYKTSR